MRFADIRVIERIVRDAKIVSPTIVSVAVFVIDVDVTRDP